MFKNLSFFKPDQFNNCISTNNYTNSCIFLISIKIAIVYNRANLKNSSPFIFTNIRVPLTALDDLRLSPNFADYLERKERKYVTESENFEK